MQHWQPWLDEQQKQPYLADTLDFIAQQRAQGVSVFPSDEHLFAAFDATEFADVKVVILGQDPYHGPNQAHGLSFSVQKGVKVPPSLRNMYKELAQSIEGFEVPEHGNLEPWARQGVLLLNTVLSVEQGKAHSHKHLGWEQFTDAVIDKLNTDRTGIVFMLWGAHAQKKGKHINTDKHHVLTSVHPSPLSAHRGFLGCNHFAQANELLSQQGVEPINWQL